MTLKNDWADGDTYGAAAVNAVASLGNDLESKTLPVFRVSEYYGGTLGGSDDTTCIQNTIDACSAAGGGIVFIPSPPYGTWWKYTQLNVARGISLRGTGWHAFDANTSDRGGTRMQQLTGVNADSIVFEGGLFAGPMGVSDLSLKGASGATAGNAISIAQDDGTPMRIQDLTTIERIHTTGFAGSAIKVTGGVPIVLSDINGLGNGQYTIEIEDVGAVTLVLLKNIAGDSNMGGVSDGGGAVVKLKSIREGGFNIFAPAISISGIKAEYRPRSTDMNGDGTSFGTFNALIIEDCDCPITVSGVTHISQWESTRKPGNAIQIKGSAVPNLMWQSVNVNAHDGQTSGTDPLAVYDEVNLRGTNIPHGVWGPAGFALDSIEAPTGRVALFQAQADAVNFFLFQGRPSNSAPVMVALGADTNIHLGFASKGTGGLYWYQNSGNMSVIVDGGDTDISVDLLPKGAGRVKHNSVDIPTISSADTITNKRNNPRVTSAASASSVTPDVSAADMYAYTALAGTLTINAPTGTPVNGNMLRFRFRDNGQARTLSWDGAFRALGVTVPTATTPNKTVYITTIWNAAESVWDVIDVKTQA